MDLHGQRVVILGGTSGIGLATAHAAARADAEVTVVSRQPARVLPVRRLPLLSEGNC